MPLTTWATVDDVFARTGADVTDETLMHASSVIEMECDRPITDSDRMGSRDLYWINMACCYQAAWLVAQFDFFTRVDRITDGHSSTLTTYPPDSFVAGPLAKRALKRVSWLKSRSLHVQSPFQDRYGSSIDPLSSEADGLYGWTPLGE